MKCIHKHCRWGDIAQVKTLLALGVHVNKVDVFNRTILMIACKYSDIKMVNYLIKYGADLNLKDHYGRTALMIACEHGWYSDTLLIISLLVKNGANVDIKDIYGAPALSHCIRFHYNTSYSIEAVKLLLKHGANPFLKNSEIKNVHHLPRGKKYSNLLLKKITNIIYKNIQNLSIQFSKQTPLYKQLWMFIFLRHKYNQIKNKKRGCYLLYQLGKCIGVKKECTTNKQILKAFENQLSRVEFKIM